MHASVKQAILTMRERYYDPITLHEIAAEVFVSPFHFSRIFARDTGVTPGRYLTSIRLFEAKRLLLTTSLTVSDIVCSVGYSSVGTFTTRFTQSVGMTPTQYRDPEVSDLLVAVSPDFRQVPSTEELRRAGRSPAGVRPASGGSIAGLLQVPPELAPANVLVGVFADSIPQCGPVAFVTLANVGSTELVLSNVPEGEWTVLAVAQRAGDGGEPGEVYIGRLRKRVTVTTGLVTRVALRMRVVEPTDPPIAITLATGGSTDERENFATGQPTLRAIA
jgi:AraC family transcriptional regulator